MNDIAQVSFKLAQAALRRPLRRQSRHRRLHRHRRSEQQYRRRRDDRRPVARFRVTFMNFLKDLLLSPRRVFVLPFAAGVGLVGGGLILAAVMHLAACPLCIIQRMLYLLVSLLALPGLLLPRAGRIAAGLLLFAAAATGAFVAGYQVWLQRFAVGESCAAQEAWWERLVDWAGEKLPWLFQGNGLCSDPAWKFLSLSIADWSLIIFGALSFYAIHALLRQRA